MWRKILDFLYPDQRACRKCGRRFKTIDGCEQHLRHYHHG